MNRDKGHVTLLVLLDLRAALDTTDHSILFQGLQSSFGISGKVLAWFQSYLKGRSQKKSINGKLSRKFDLVWGFLRVLALVPCYLQSTEVRCFRSSSLTSHLLTHMQTTRRCTCRLVQATAPMK